MKTEKFVFAKQDIAKPQKSKEHTPRNNEALTDIQRFLKNCILLEMMQDVERVSVCSLKQKERLEL